MREQSVATLISCLQVNRFIFIQATFSSQRAITDTFQEVPFMKFSIISSERELVLDTRQQIAAEIIFSQLLF